MPADALVGGIPDSVHGGTPAGAALAPETRERLRAELGHRFGSETVAFAAQVTRQVAHPLGATHDDGSALPPMERERAVAARTAAIIRAACDDDEAAAAHAATRLAEDVALLSAFFQNLDLLPTRDVAGDAIAMLVTEAMGRLGGG